VSAVAFFNGRLLAEDDAAVSIFDGGWLHGAGLFETMRAERSRVFRLEKHIERLRRSAEKLLRPMERAALPSAADFAELLDRNGLAGARVRLTVSAGPMRGIADDCPEALTVCGTAAPMSNYPAKFYETGIQVIVCPFKQSASDPTVGHKTTGYLPRLVGLREAQKAHCTEALWFNEKNELAEGSISNVFLVRGDVLTTPPLETPVLPGLTREAVIQLAGERGIRTKECALTIHDLLDADECFLTNTIMEVMPVIRVERRDIADGKVGPTTRQLRDAYRGLVVKECAE